MFVYGGKYIELEPRPEEEFPHKQALHHALHVTEAGREWLRTRRKRLDETFLKYNRVLLFKQHLLDLSMSEIV